MEPAREKFSSVLLRNCDTFNQFSVPLDLKPDSFDSACTAPCSRLMFNINSRFLILLSQNKEPLWPHDGRQLIN